MKRTKKIILTISLLLILISTTVMAATTSSANATLSIVENKVCTINITDKAVFEKKIVDYNLDKKEVTIGLKVTNNATLPLDKPSEIVLLIDNSLSMKENISNTQSRMEAVSSSAKTLATTLLKYNTVKMSVVSFSTGDSEGTISDAKLRSSLTTSKDDILSAIDAVANDATGVRTDIEAGLTLASEQFSGTCENEFIILLTDGVPNVSLGSNKIQYSGATATNTKSALNKLADKGINIYSMMTGVTTATETQTGKTYKELAEEVFGTSENPTVGKFYYITDDKIEETVSKTILNSLVAPEDDIILDLDIYDYFPQDIIDNFNFEYVTLPKLGTVSEDIDLQNNLIVWHIDRLGYGESDTLSYKLTLKDNIDSKIVGVVLNTNEKVDITTKNVVNEDGSKKLITSDVTPKIKVDLKKDDTTADTNIPQTGSTITMFVIIATSLIVCSVFGFRAYKKVK